MSLSMQARPFQRQPRYCTTRRELAVVMFGLKYYRHFVLGFPFVLCTDHAALTHLMRTSNPVEQSARYLDMAEYQFTVQYRPDTSKRNADALNRRPCGRESNVLLCRQCGPLLDPVAEDSDAKEAAMKTDDHGCGIGTAGLHSGLDSVEADSNPVPGLVEVVS